MYNYPSHSINPTLESRLQFISKNSLQKRWNMFYEFFGLVQVAASESSLYPPE
jgi:hypothetical protein